jgi:hypothetical protein
MAVLLLGLLINIRDESAKILKQYNPRDLPKWNA